MLWPRYSHSISVNNVLDIPLHQNVFEQSTGYARWGKCVTVGTASCVVITITQKFIFGIPSPGFFLNYFILLTCSVSGMLLFLVKPQLSWTGPPTAIPLLVCWSIQESRQPYFFSHHSQISDSVVWTTWIWKSRPLGSLWNFILNSNLNNSRGWEHL